MTNKLKNLALFLLCLLAANSAWADEKIEVDGFYYWLYDSRPGVCQLTSKDDQYATYSGDVAIPETVTYNGTTLRVTDIGIRAFYKCDALTSVTIPSSITRVLTEAFANCSALKQISFPNSVKEFGTSVLDNCTSLEEVELPVEMSRIPGEMFYNCESLKAIDIPETVTEIGNLAFSGCKALTSVVVPNSVVKMGSSVFERDWNLQKVVLSENLQSIGKSIFHECKALTQINIPESLTTIPSKAFSTCSSLEAIYLHSGVTSVDWTSSFEGTDKLATIVIDKNNQTYTVLGELVYDKYFKTIHFCPKPKAGDIIVHKKVQTVADKAFYYCQNITTLMLPKNIKTVGANAFSSVFEQPGFTDLYCFGTTLPSVQSSSFVGNSNLLKNVTLHVLKGKASDYTTHKTWKRFTKVVDELEIFDEGDINHDHRISLSDLTALVDLLIHGEITDLDPYVSDVNDDNQFDAGDVKTIAEICLRIAQN